MAKTGGPPRLSLLAVRCHMPVMNDPAYGRVAAVNHLVRGVLAPNPSAFTFTGTQSFIVGHGEVAVIDPGPDIDSHVQALLDAVTGETVIAILCTHTHRDHSPASRALAAATGAAILGCAPLAPESDGAGGDDSFDAAYAPDRVLLDGDAVEGPGWTLRAVATPGHTSNHLCFALEQEGVLFSGDHVMGWSTSIVSPPDGDMGAYVASLQRLLERDDRIYLPAHGPAIEAPRAHVRGLIGHRRMRESQVLKLLDRSAQTSTALVTEMYKDVDPRLHPAAERSVLAHLLDLQSRRAVREEEGLWLRA